MGAKVLCKKGYNLSKEGYVEFTQNDKSAFCPASGESCCVNCSIKSFVEARDEISK